MIEETCKKKKKEDVFAKAETLWCRLDAREQINTLFQEEYKAFGKKVIVLDDDPTGIQTVHDIPVYTDWSEESLTDGCKSEKQMFFVLTNSRSFSEEKTTEVHKEIAAAVKRAQELSNQSVMVISRGDSTLRGHYPLETRILKETLEADGAETFHGELLCPFFKEGGRFTVDGIHYVQEGEWLVPAAQTEFAKDKTFGYAHSNLAAYIEEKSAGMIAAESVIVVTLEQLRGMQWEEIETKIEQAEGFCYIVADALEETDVKAMAIVLMRLMKKGKQFMIRSAAAVTKVFGNVSDRPLLSREELVLEETSYGGMVLVGSHVKKTTMQLASLKEAACPMEWIEFHVNTWQEEDGLEKEAKLVTKLAEEAMEQGKTAVVYTSRTLLAPEGLSAAELLAISVNISNAVTSVVSRLHKKPRFLIAKGGITSSDVGTKGLAVKKAWAIGQIQPGIPVWRTGAESKFPNMSYVIFPGNVGAETTLKTIVELLA